MYSSYAGPRLLHASHRLSALTPAASVVSRQLRTASLLLPFFTPRAHAPTITQAVKEVLMPAFKSASIKGFVPAFAKVGETLVFHAVMPLHPACCLQAGTKLAWPVAGVPAV